MIAFSACKGNIDSSSFPKPVGCVNDYAKIISPQITRKLITLIQELEQETSAELAIVTINNLEGKKLESYAKGLFNQWGIGKKGKNNGVLILVAVAERKVRLEVGYGFESIISDEIASKIIQEQIIPSFKMNNFGEGLRLGALAVSQSIAKDAGVVIRK